MSELLSIEDKFVNLPDDIQRNFDHTVDAGDFLNVRTHRLYPLPQLKKYTWNVHIRCIVRPLHHMLDNHRH